jgi:hypothetical protein
VKKILLQTTIPFSADDWTIDRFFFVLEYLSSLTDESGACVYRITARSRDKSASSDDPVLSTLDAGDYDQLWLLGVDLGNSLSNNKCKAIQRFRQ